MGGLFMADQKSGEPSSGPLQERWMLLTVPIPPVHFQPFHCFCNRSALLKLAASFPHRVPILGSGSPNKNISTASHLSITETEAISGQDSLGGYMMGELSDTLSTQPELSPLLHQMWQ